MTIWSVSCSGLKMDNGVIGAEFNGDKQPHQLHGLELSRILLDLFGIRLKILWPQGPRLPTTRSAQDYYMAQFEEVWAEYLRGSETDLG